MKKKTPIADYFYALTTAVLEHVLLIAGRGQGLPIPRSMDKSSRRRVWRRLAGR